MRRRDIPTLSDCIRRRQREGRMPVLAEIKCRSPRDGDLLRARSPRDLAHAMTRHPVAGLSVVTEAAWFGGSIETVRMLAPWLPVPILRKDFIVEATQVVESAAAGAAAILLIVRHLDAERLHTLHVEAHRHGLETVIEVHSEAELELLQDARIVPDVVGINNRDIAVGETDAADVGVTERIAPRVRGGGQPLLSESSLRDAADVVRAREAGADAVLVGTSLLLSADLDTLLASMIDVGWPG